MEAIHKYTNLDPTTPEGMTILNMHFINQSAPEICRKLTKMVLGPQAPTQHLLEVATGVFNNRDMAVRQERNQRAKLQGKIQAQVLATAIANSSHHQTNQEQGQGLTPDKRSGKTPCFRCGQGGHWSKGCPNKGSPPGPCPACKKEGHWKRDCPHLQGERRSGAHFPAQELKLEELA